MEIGKNVAPMAVKVLLQRFIPRQKITAKVAVIIICQIVIVLLINPKTGLSINDHHQICKMYD